MAKTDDDILVHRVKRNNTATKDSRPKSGSETVAKKVAGKQETDETKQKFDKQFTRNIKVLGAFIAIFAVLLLLALVSYTPADEAFLSVKFRDLMGLIRADESVISQTGQIHNLLGLLGAYISNYFYNMTFGYAAVFVPLYLIYWAVSLYKYQKISEKVLKNTTVYFILALIFSGIMGLLRKIELFPDLSQEFSGIVGYYIASILYSIIGGAGGVVFLVVLTLITLYYGFEIKFKTIKGVADKVVYSDKSTWKNAFSVIVKPYKKLLDYSRRLSVNKPESKVADTMHDGKKAGGTVPASATSPVDVNTASVPNDNIVTGAFRRPAGGVEPNENISFATTARMIRRNVGRVDEEKIDDSRTFEENLREPSFVAVRDHSFEETAPRMRPSRPQPVINHTYEAYSVPTTVRQSEPRESMPNRKVIVPDIKHQYPPYETDEVKNDSNVQYQAPVEDNDFSADADEKPHDVSENRIEEIDDYTVANAIEKSSDEATSIGKSVLSATTTLATNAVTTSIGGAVAGGSVATTTVLSSASSFTGSSVKPKLELFVNEPVEDQIIQKLPKCPISTSSLEEKIHYVAPTFNLLSDTNEEVKVDEEELKENARILQEKLETFKIYIENLSITPGPVVTQYEFVPAAGIKISKISSLADDIAMALKARGIRIISPIPGKGTVGIEIPNQNPSLVHFSSIIKSVHFHDDRTKTLPLALGKNISGEVYITDLAKMPHLLIAGSTGSGKSVGINTIICSLLYKMHPKDLKFVIIDPKKVELNMYAKLAHHFLALSPDIDEEIITEPENAVIILKALCAEMDLRYDILAKAQQRKISDYNEKVNSGQLKDRDDMTFLPMPYIVCIVDELADLMLKAGKDVETPIIRLAQLARAVGIHLVVATQRPSVDVITGIIKANFPARISYLVASKIDSRTILDVMGAEQLLGNGDMLLLANSPKPVRIQNAFISTDEVEAICDFIGNQKGFSEPYYLPSVKQEQNGKGMEDARGDDRDPLFEEAARLVIRQQVASVSLVQRRLKVGYARAGRIIDELEAAGIVSQFDGSKSRNVFLESESQLEAIL